MVAKKLDDSESARKVAATAPDKAVKKAVKKVMYI